MLPINHHIFFVCFTFLRSIFMTANICNLFLTSTGKWDKLCSICYHSFQPLGLIYHLLGYKDLKQVIKYCTFLDFETGLSANVMAFMETMILLFTTTSYLSNKYATDTICERISFWSTYPGQRTVTDRTGGDHQSKGRSFRTREDCVPLEQNIPTRYEGNKLYLIANHFTSICCTGKNSSIWSFHVN